MVEQAHRQHEQDRLPGKGWCYHHCPMQRALRRLTPSSREAAIATLFFCVHSPLVARADNSKITANYQAIISGLTANFRAVAAAVSSSRSAGRIGAPGQQSARNGPSRGADWVEDPGKGIFRPAPSENSAAHTGLSSFSFAGS